MALWRCSYLDHQLAALCSLMASSGEAGDGEREAGCRAVLSWSLAPQTLHIPNSSPAAGGEVEGGPRGEKLPPVCSAWLCSHPLESMGWMESHCSQFHFLFFSVHVKRLCSGQSRAELARISDSVVARGRAAAGSAPPSRGDAKHSDRSKISQLVYVWSRAALGCLRCARTMAHPCPGHRAGSIPLV